jgi:serine/threonine-protein kinase HipA
LQETLPSYRMIICKRLYFVIYVLYYGKYFRSYIFTVILSSLKSPSLAESFNLVRNHSTRAAKDVLSLPNWVIFNYLIGNSDAHGKNLSLLLLEKGPVLATVYDLLSTRVYAHYGLAAKMAMKIGGENNPQAVQKKHWQQFAEDVGIKPHLVLTRVAALARKIEVVRLQLFQDAFAPYRCDALYRLMGLVSEQTETTLKRIL